MSHIDHIPRHMAIIMDGNGRWAQEQGLPRIEGHRSGTENCRRIIEASSRYGVEYLTLYAFSTENWGRPRDEVNGLFRILRGMIDRESEALHLKDVKIRHLGRLDGLPENLKQQIERAVELTRKNTGMTLSVAINYGGRAEIIDAVKRIIRDGIEPESMDEVLLGSYLYTEGLPDPDLIIRTAGEMRVSNFLIWQGAYSEYYSTPTFWPEFDEEELQKALTSYSHRERRFGNVKPRQAGKKNEGQVRVEQEC